MQVDKNKQNTTFHKASERAESQSYRHFCNCVEGRTTGLQTDS